VKTKNPLLWQTTKENKVVRIATAITTTTGRATLQTTEALQLQEGPVLNQAAMIITGSLTGNGQVLKAVARIAAAAVTVNVFCWCTL
jgi:hypothetical protein